MGKTDDAFERLRASNPVRESDVEGPESAKAQELLARILGTPRVSSPSPVRGPQPAWRIPVYLIIGIATVAAAVVWTLSIQSPNLITCHDSVTLDAENQAHAPSDAQATAEACAPLWEEGILSNPEIVPPGSIPPLVACVDTDGRLHVFPTADLGVCTTLGLAQPDPETQDEADAVRKLEATLVSYFNEIHCASFAEAESFIQRTLEDLELEGWSIQSQGAQPQRPCASFSLDAPARTIHLVALPDPG